MIEYHVITKTVIPLQVISFHTCRGWAERAGAHSLALVPLPQLGLRLIPRTSLASALASWATLVSFLQLPVLVAAS